MAKRKRKKKFAYNRIIHAADYHNLGVYSRKSWEVEMAVKTLTELGAVHGDAEIIGVGAGKEETIFRLSANVKRVVATDIYATPGEWGSWHGQDFMRNPAAFAPAGVSFDVGRINVQHADMRALPFDDDTFDGLFSSGSIEHVGVKGTPNYEAIQKAASEIGRVLKPGGVASISTEWRLSGTGWGWDNVCLFDANNVHEHIIEPSGLEMVGEPDWKFDGDLRHYVKLVDVVMNGCSDEGYALIRQGDFLFTSVHLALRKPE